MNVGLPAAPHYEIMSNEGRASVPANYNRRPLGQRALALAVASCFVSTAQGNPTGPSVAAGSATFATSGNTLSVTNTPGAIINWAQFSIQRDEITRFIQQNAASAVLN